MIDFPAGLPVARPVTGPVAGVQAGLVTGCVAGPCRARRALTKLGRGGIAAALTMLLMFTFSGVSSAHVTVNADDVTAGSWTVLTFRAPTESDTESTVSLTVSLPTDHPLPQVSVRQMPGWTAEVTETNFDSPVTEGKFVLNKAVSAVTWTADDGVGIGPGEFAEFALSVGPVPDVPSLAFPAEQTYSDGSVVNWDEVAEDGAEEPDHPEPRVTVSSADASAEASGSSSAATVEGSDTTAQILGVVGLIVAAIALLLAIVALRRRPVRPARTETTGTTGTTDAAEATSAEPLGTTPSATPPAQKDS